MKNIVRALVAAMAFTTGIITASPAHTAPIKMAQRDPGPSKEPTVVDCNDVVTAVFCRACGYGGPGSCGAGDAVVICDGTYPTWDPKNGVCVK